MLKFNEYVENKSIENALKAVARTIKHSGDYGVLFYNDTAKKVHWTAADGDGHDYNDEVQLTSLKDIKKMFEAVPGVKSVEIGDEWSPKGEDWVKLDYK